MSESVPSRSQILEFREERRAMADGYSFLDEKCLLLAGEILRELRQHDQLRVAVAAAADAAGAALAAAITQHGLEALQLQAPAELAAVRLERNARMLMGVKLNHVQLDPQTAALLPVQAGMPASRFMVDCAAAFAALLALAAPLGATVANLERLGAEYRRAIRRARALHDVLLPEIDSRLEELETRLEDLEREDAIAMRLGARR